VIAARGEFVCECESVGTVGVNVKHHARADLRVGFGKGEGSRDGYYGILGSVPDKGGGRALLYVLFERELYSRFFIYLIKGLSRKVYKRAEMSVHHSGGDGISEDDGVRSVLAFGDTEGREDGGVVRGESKRACEVSARGKAYGENAARVYRIFLSVLADMKNGARGVDKLLRVGVSILSDAVIKDEAVKPLCKVSEGDRLAFTLGADVAIAAAGDNEHCVTDYCTVVCDIGIYIDAVVGIIEVDSFVKHSFSFRA